MIDALADHLVQPATGAASGVGIENFGFGLYPRNQEKHRRYLPGWALLTETCLFMNKAAGRQIKVWAGGADILISSFVGKESTMEISPLSTNTAMTAIARQLNTNSAMQTEMLKQMADSQQQMAELLQAIGVGQQVDVQA